MTRSRNDSSPTLTSWVHHIIYLNHPRLHAVLRWCVGLTLVAVVVYTANQKISVVPNLSSLHHASWADLTESAASGSGGDNSTTQGSIRRGPERRRLFGRKDDIEFIIKNERARIGRDMSNYTFKDSVHLRDLDMESGGSPIRALVTTTWRSGSTFLGDILLSHPATYYHYEPLLHFGIEQVRTGRKAREALRVIKSLFNCDYSKLGAYTNYGIEHNYLFTHNFPLWRRCQQFDKSLCWNPEFLTRMCRLFPFQSMKTVRLRLKLTKPILEDPSLNVRVLLLVRDPRGTMESRHHRDWCPGNPDCEDPEKLCSDLVEDYHSAQQLIKIFPNRIKVIRYEDFSSDPYTHSKEVLEFFGFTFHENVKAFLDTHTKINYGGVSSTFRDSKTVPFQWKKKLAFPEVKMIQGNCSEAMKLWGYKMAGSAEELAQLEPILPFKFTEKQALTKKPAPSKDKTKGG